MAMYEESETSASRRASHIQICLMYAIPRSTPNPSDRGQFYWRQSLRTLTSMQVRWRLSGLFTGVEQGSRSSALSLRPA